MIFQNTTAACSKFFETTTSLSNKQKLRNIIEEKICYTSIIFSPLHRKIIVNPNTSLTVGSIEKSAR